MGGERNEERGRGIEREGREQGSEESREEEVRNGWKEMES